MKYDNISRGIFLERPNRFIAYVDINGIKEVVHVKNTGRCKELLIEGVEVFVHRAGNPERKTKWDLIGVRKGNVLVNMDSQIPNVAVKEWLEQGNLIEGITNIKPECTYQKSRFDLYVEAGSKKVFIEVKGVTLEEDGVARFPDAPSERAVKHVEELIQAVKNGYHAYVFFVVQMAGIRYFTPNTDTHPAFAEALSRAEEAGVKIVAYECKVGEDFIQIHKEVPVVLKNPELHEIAQPLIVWYRKNKRQLPWRNNPDAYRVWVSEIMLQQTRVEAVKSYYDRFLQELPTVEDLAKAEEDKLLKLWEGLGYYNRVRNMQKAARQVMVEFHGEFPHTYEGILSLKGIGSYTAGAIGAFAYGIAKPAVDGNVLRVISRILASRADVTKQKVKRQMEEQLETVIPKEEASDFNQGLIELGAMVCVPNASPKCNECPLLPFCRGAREGNPTDFPVKQQKKQRKIEEKTILVFRDGDFAAIKKRADKGLLAGLYELPNVNGHLSKREVLAHSKKLGLQPIHIKELGEAKHIFSHIEWRMIGYLVRVDELEKSCKEDMLFVHPQEIKEKYPIPSAFEKYTNNFLKKL